MKKIVAGVLIMGLAALLGSCKKEGGEDAAPTPGSSTLWGEGVTATVYGQVLDVNGSAVSGAQVIGGTVNTLTDGQGVFRLSGITAFKQLGYIRVEKSGYFSGSRSFVPLSGGNRVNIRLLSNTPSGTVSASQGGTVSAQGAAVTLPANGVVKNNVAYTGTVNVSLRPISPQSATFWEEMPGNLIGVQNDQSRGLLSYGMVAAELRDNSGQLLQMAPGQTATVRFPIGAQQQAGAPASIDLWSFDEVNGYWKHEGSATRQGNEYIAQVSHFSFWNCDIPGDWISLQGSITVNGSGLQGAVVTLSSQANGSATDYTNSLGFFGGWVPANQSLTMTVQVPCGGSTTTVLTQSIGPFTANTTLNPIGVIGGGTQVTGTLVDCNNAALTSGYVIADGQVHFANGAGQFSFSTCGGSTTVYPYGSNPFVAGTALQVPTGGNMGNVPVCSNGGGTGSVTDINGNTYSTVQIGTQEWMQENLKVANYRNGDAIPTNLSDAAWQSTTSGAYALYDNDPANNTVYGKLYNWYAVADPRGLCPTGWHVPSDTEWTTLENFLGGSSVAGGKMKAVGDLQSGTGLWQSPNTDATNLSGFSGLPGGLRITNGSYSSIGDVGYWWSSTQGSTNDAWIRNLSYTIGVVYRPSTNKSHGFSVRCVRD